MLNTNSTIVSFNDTSKSRAARSEVDQLETRTGVVGTGIMGEKLRRQRCQNSVRHGSAFLADGCAVVAKAISRSKPNQQSMHLSWQAMHSQRTQVSPY